ncbi:MAG TPA: hypothetical protein VME66_12140 [Candidatus Acidoferrales bacterium]|nr:hypothetical protein [Candidatus Acidoferrales bacterium]
MEFVRKEVYLGPMFSAQAFESAFAQFRSLYNVVPLRAVCSPDVLARFCALYERSPESAHLHSTRLRYEGVPLVAAILAPGTIAFEGEVDENRMGDW